MYESTLLSIINTATNIARQFLLSKNDFFDVAALRKRPWKLVGGSDVIRNTPQTSQRDWNKYKCPSNCVKISPYQLQITIGHRLKI